MEESTFSHAPEVPPARSGRGCPKPLVHSDEGGNGWRSSGEYEDALVMSMVPIHDVLNRLHERFGRMVQQIKITQLKTVYLNGMGAESFIKRNACTNVDTCWETMYQSSRSVKA